MSNYSFVKKESDFLEKILIDCVNFYFKLCQN